MREIEFQVSARTAQLIGRQNVSNAEGAIFELVKNAYDADAKNCLVALIPHYAEIPTYVHRETMFWLNSISSLNLFDYYQPQNSRDTVLVEMPDDARQIFSAELAEIMDLWIIDDGTGMTADVIENQWMVIGTDNKAANTKTRKGRSKTGAKGIGRFALDRLGRDTWLSSRTDDERVEWGVNWDQFENQRTLSEVKALLGEDSLTVKESIIESEYSHVVPVIEEIFDIGSKHTGTAIRVGRLRDQWNENQVESLESSLLSLMPPVEGAREFSVTLHDTREPEKFGAINPSSPTDYDYKLNADFNSKTGIVKFIIHRNEIDMRLVDPDLFEIEELKKRGFNDSSSSANTYQYDKSLEELFNGASEELLESFKSLGDFKFTLYFSKMVVSKKDRHKYPYKSFRSADRKAWYDEYGGVSVFRDTFKVRPYGIRNSQSFDWLSLGQRRSKSPAAISRRGAYRVDPAQVIGILEISRNENPKLDDQSNREGISDSSALKLLKQFLIRIISEFESDRNILFVHLNNLHKAKNQEEQTNQEADKIAADIGKSPSGVSPDQAKTLAESLASRKSQIEALYSELSMMRALSSMGTVLLSFSHELAQLRLTSKDRFRTFSQLLEKYLPSAELSDVKPALNPYHVLTNLAEDDKKVEQWFDFALSSIVSRKRQMLDIDLGGYLEAIKNRWYNLLFSREINLDIYVEPNLLCVINAHEIDFDSIFNNLIVNSKEAFLRSPNIGNRKIKIELLPDVLPGHVRVDYQDSGPGLSPHFSNPHEIFDFNVSTKLDPESGEKSGTGLGMWIMKSVVDEYQGSIAFMSKSELGGFGLSITLPVIEVK